MGNETLTDQIEGETTKDGSPKFTALLAGSEESGSEYEGPASGDSQTNSETETEDEPICEEGPELEDEEPDTNIQLKTSKKKKGVVARDQISAAVVAIDDKQSPSPTNHGAPKKAAASKT